MVHTNSQLVKSVSQVLRPISRLRDNLRRRDRKDWNKIAPFRDDRTTMHMTSLTSAVAACTRPAQEQTSQHSSMEWAEVQKTLTPRWWALDTEWLLWERGSFLFKGVAPVGQPYSGGWAHIQYLNSTNESMYYFKRGGDEVGKNEEVGRIWGVRVNRGGIQIQLSQKLIF